MNTTAIFEFIKSPAVWITFIVAILALIGIIFFIRNRNKHKPVQTKEMEELKLITSKVGTADIAKAGLHEAKKDEKPEQKISKGLFEIKEALRINEPDCKYPAVIRWLPKPGRMPVIEFNARIDKPLGDLFFAEPSSPRSGEAFYIKQNEDGTFSPYDPRKAAILSNKSPYLAYDATHWDEAEKVWVFKTSFTAKLSAILMWVVIGIFFIVVLVKIGG